MKDWNGLYDVEELDGVLKELDAAGKPHKFLAGRRVRWHNDRKYTLVEWKDTIAIRMRLHCERCGRRGVQVYLHGGMHEGAWCYAYNKRGMYLTNLRDHSYICKACSPDVYIGTTLSYGVKIGSRVKLVKWGELPIYDYDVTEGDLPLEEGLTGVIHSVDSFSVPAQVCVSLDTRHDHDVCVLAHSLIPA